MPPSWREVSESRDLRAGLLPRGTTQSSTWASYDEDHLRRLRLVRALADVAGLSLEEVRGVVDAVAASEFDHQARGAAQWSLSPDLARDPSAASVERVDRLLSRHVGGGSTPTARTDEL